MVSFEVKPSSDNMATASCNCNSASFFGVAYEHWLPGYLFLVLSKEQQLWGEEGNGVEHQQRVTEEQSNKCRNVQSLKSFREKI